MFKNLNLTNPGVLIGMLIGITVAVQIVVDVFPDIVTQIVAMGGLANFSFATLFQGGGVVLWILSALILFGIFSIFGVNMGGSKR